MASYFEIRIQLVEKITTLGGYGGSKEHVLESENVEQENYQYAKIAYDIAKRDIQ